MDIFGNLLENSGSYFKLISWHKLKKRDFNIL